MEVVTQGLRTAQHSQNLMMSIQIFFSLFFSLQPLSIVHQVDVLLLQGRFVFRLFKEAFSFHVTAILVWLMLDSNIKTIEDYCYNQNNVLGHGTYAAVYRGYMLGSEVPVAVKVIPIQNMNAETLRNL